MCSPFLLLKILDVHWHNMDLLQNDSLHLRMSHFLLLVKEHERKLLHPRQRVQDSRPGDKNCHSLWSTLFCKILLFATSLIPKDKSLLSDLQEVNSSCAICETCFLLYVICNFVPSHLFPCWHVNMIEGAWRSFSQNKWSHPFHWRYITIWIY